MLNGEAACSPHSVRVLLGNQASAPSSLAQRLVGQLGILQRTQRNESGRAGNVGDDETVQVLDYRPSELLRQPARITLVTLVQRLQVFVPISLEDDGGRKTEANQDQVEQKPAGTAVAV